MSLKRFHVLTLTVWFGALALLLAVPAAFGVPVSPEEVLGVVLLGGGAAIIFLVVFRGAPRRSPARALYDEPRDASRGGARRNAPTDR